MGYLGEKQSPIKAELEALLPRLQKFAAALTGSGQAASELTAAACQAVLTRAAREKGQTQLLLWSLTLMHTAWTERLVTRTRQRHQEPVEPGLFLGTVSPSAAIAPTSLAKFISHLPPQQRGTLMLVYGFGLSYDEAAEVFGVQVSTVMTRLVRSHTSMARWLDHRGLSAATPAALPAQAHVSEHYEYRAYEEQAA